MIYKMKMIMSNVKKMIVLKSAFHMDQLSGYGCSAVTKACCEQRAKLSLNQEPHGCAHLPW